MIRSAIRVLALLLLVPALLFAAAGTLRWPLAWAYVALATSATLASRSIIAHKSPETLAERAKGFRAEGTQPWDRWLVSPVIWGAVVTLLVAALDHRWGWSSIASAPLRVSALGLAALGYALAAWAMAENRFFYATVRLQRDRGHTVVSGGPYGLVRHPAYAGSLLVTLLVPVILGSVWAFVPAGLTAVAIVVRTALEDRFLRRELEGYDAYASRTRRRLIPGVW